MSTLLHSVTIMTMTDDAIINGYVIVDDNGYFKDISSGVPTKEGMSSVDTVIDGKGKWLLPGLINTHGHLGSTFLRGAGDDIPLMKWLQTVMWPAESKFTKETVQNAASLALLEMIKSGTTTFLDMYHLHMNQMAELVINSKMRAVLCRGMIGLCSEEEQKEKLLESVQLYHDYHGANDNKITVALSPHAPYTCPPKFLEMVVDKAIEHNMWIHTHLSETNDEVVKHEEKYGLPPVEHLNKIGLFQNHCLIAHGVHVSENEQEILLEKNVSVSHNPMSNLKLGSGIAPIPIMMKKGINISLGTDSTASNNNLDLFEEMRFASLIQKGLYEDPTITRAMDVVQMATINGAKALRLNKLGMIQKGQLADFILINPNVPHLQPWDNSRVLSHIVYSVKGTDVTDSFVQGIQIMKDRQVLTLDEEKIMHEANNYLKLTDTASS
ncbi:amidohydrolase [Evansella sp. AB-P1]|uniref:amidohydrolase n=1 Tax=Evansella sp. AB-P1 TaxID=3037653 RepID=UPI00241DC37D|nr:amidohydrolase [Evansella sp. AB-P1]MDG5787560.1 amidohydrolase [Evansella sp. AB-P1]